MQQPKSVSILVVDDDDVAVEAITRGLRKCGLQNPVVVAENGVEALQIMRGAHAQLQIARPYIILLDLNMPRMNGLEFLREVRSDLLLHDAVVYVLTTSDAEWDKSQAYAEHVAGYIVKQKLSTDFEEVAAVLRQYGGTVSLPS